MRPTKGILFSGVNVLGILAGRKTQTRRIFKLPKWAHPNDRGEDIPLVCHKSTGCLVEVQPAYPVGSVNYVKETWQAYEPKQERFGGNTALSNFMVRWHSNVPKEGHSEIEYRADKPDGGGSWRSSIFMPRWAARLWLEVTAVRVERLNSITAADAIAEGLEPGLFGKTFRAPGYALDRDAVGAYEALWESINGKGSWAKNPFVFAYTFKRIPKPA